MHYTNKTSTTLAIVAIVTAVALVTAGSITASALAKKHASTTAITSASSTKRATGSSSQLISCIRSLHGQITLAAVDDCYNTASGKQFGSSPGGTSSSSSSASALMTGKTARN